MPQPPTLACLAAAQAHSVSQVTIWQDDANVHGHVATPMGFTVAVGVGAGAGLVLSLSPRRRA